MSSGAGSSSPAGARPVRARARVGRGSSAHASCRALGAALVMASAPAFVTLTTEASRRGSGAGPARAGRESRGRRGPARRRLARRRAGVARRCTLAAFRWSWRRSPSEAGSWCPARPPARRAPPEAGRTAGAPSGREAGADRRGLAIASAALMLRMGGALRRVASRALLPDRPARLPVRVGGNPFHDRTARAGGRRCPRRAAWRTGAPGAGSRRWASPSRPGPLAHGPPRRRRRRRDASPSRSGWGASAPGCSSSPTCTTS